MNTSNATWNTRSRRVTPGGVHSPVRSFDAVGGEPTVIERGEGAYLYDVKGRAYIDLIGCWGAAILGHAHPQVTRAIEQAARAGTSFGLNSPNEIRLSERIVELVPSVEMVRLVNSGTEAVSSAIRLARAATQRDVIVKLAGCYHGHADHLLTRAGSGLATLGLPDCPGVPADAAKTTITIPFNSTGAARELFAAHGREIAALIIEPVAGNMGVIRPEDGYLESLRAMTHESGSLLIFDEVMTGFRLARGGAQELFSVTPDLTTFAKIIGGGLPVGAFGGRAELMELIAPLGPVYQAGTMSGSPLATAAGAAALELIGIDAYKHLEELGERLERGLRGAFESANIATTIHRAGSMISVFFAPGSVANLEDAMRTDRDVYQRFFHGMLRAGVHLPPSPLESWFISLAHTQLEIAAVIDAAHLTARSMRSEILRQHDAESPAFTAP